MKKVEGIGARLRQIRGQRTQKEFAEILGVNVNTLRRYEYGKRKIHHHTKEALRTKHGVNLEWLEKGEGNPQEGGVREPYVILEELSEDVMDLAVWAKIYAGRGRRVPGLRVMRERLLVAARELEACAEACWECADDETPEGKSK